MFRRSRFPPVLQMLLTTSLFLLYGDLMADSVVADEFQTQVLQLEQDPPRESVLKISCRMEFQSEKTTSGQYATVLMVEGDKSLIIALSPHELVRPWETMALRPVFVKTGESHPTQEGTMDWAYVFDRNRDGRIDYFSYLVGPVWMAPQDEAKRASLPVTGESISVEFAETYQDKLELAFWHLADDNYDGDHDRILARLQDSDTGWTYGWVIAADTDFDRTYDSCHWTRGELDGPSQPCAQEGNEFSVPGHSVNGLSQLPFPQGSLLDTFNHVVSGCRIDADRLYATPLRPGWPYERDESELHACYASLEFDSCLALAEAGDARAQERLGYMYANGEGVSNDDDEALSWLRKSAAQGHPTGQYNLGYMYYFGRGVPEDHAMAAEWYLKAANQDDVLAQKVLSACYQDGDGVRQDEGEAVRWIARAATLGDASAQLAIGLRYAAGMGVKKDEVTAYAWWLLASMNGSARARQGVELYSKILSRKQVEKAKELALEIHERTLELAAERANPD